MNAETQKALWQKLHLDKPILAITEEKRHILLHLLGGEVVQVDRQTLAAQLSLEGSGDSPVDAALPAAPALPAANPPRRSHRKT